MSVRQIRRGESGYPRSVFQRLGDEAPGAIHILGEADLPSQVDLALVCSVSCPGGVIVRMYDAIRGLREAGVVIAGGFHSPMERECLDFLLRGKQAVVLCPAFGLDSLQLGAPEQRAVDEQRLHAVSVLGSGVIHATRESAALRNAFVAALAVSVFVPHAVPGGQAESIARQSIARGQMVLTFDDEENQHLIAFGALPFLDSDFGTRRLTTTIPLRGST